MPGRYEHNRDPRLAELLHHVTEEGWGNDSVGDLDQDGFHASLLVVEPAEQQELSEAFDRAIPAGSWIVTEDQQGFVIVDQYLTPVAARYAFDRLPDLDGPGEEDGTITPAGPLGNQYAVVLAGSFLGYADDLDQAIAMLREAWTRTAIGRMPGSSATTATPTASTSRCRDHPSVPLEDRARPGWRCRNWGSGAMAPIGESGSSVRGGHRPAAR